MIAAALVFSLVVAWPSYAEESITSTKDEIRNLFNSAISSYPAISEKATISDENAKLEILKLEMSDYLTLARKLEEQQQYRQAADCYQKVFELCQDPKLKKLIKLRNKELQKQLQRIKKAQKSDSKKIANKNLLDARKPTASSKMSNLEKQHTQKSKLLQQLQQKLQKLEEDNDEY